MENKQLALAKEFIKTTNRHIFLTGKAGTGKTTFLQEIRQQSQKRFIVVAPTGIAALNANGVTINSFFQLPFSPFIPEKPITERAANSEENRRFVHKLNRSKIKTIQNLDLVIIDEISMVRADMLDAIDDVLRKYRHSSLPFGGVQLLMIGDLHQLSPIAKPDEWQILKDYYQSLYFFDSLALQKTNYSVIELEHIYRQNDPVFINILNEIRENKLSPNSIEILNQKYISDFAPQDYEGYITLTTHNKYAQKINQDKLKSLRQKTHHFSAILKNDFPEFMFPTEEKLSLKVNSQVMFVKNDPSPEKKYYNGKIGKITRIEDDIIYVKCDTDKEDIPVKQELWENLKYSLDEKEKEIKEEVIGCFKQYPLKLAWAITIHKSQGLTFEKAIIDVNSAFAFGQVYVALSRCRSLDGLVMLSKINPSNIKSDFHIDKYTKQVIKLAPTFENLAEAKISYQQDLILDLFNFEEIKKFFFTVRKIYQNNITIFSENHTEIFSEMTGKAFPEIFEVNEKFIWQLNSLFQTDILPEENAQLQERIKKASCYYTQKFTEIFLNNFSKLTFATDNKEVRKNLKSALKELEFALCLKLALLRKAQTNFKSQEYLKILTEAETTFVPHFSQQSQKQTLNKESLLDLLIEWRDQMAEEMSCEGYKILTRKTVNELVKNRPTNLNELSEINGIGKVKLQTYGEEILEIIRDYCQEHGLELSPEVQLPLLAEPMKKKKVKKDTKKISFTLYQEGKSLQEIAATRNLAESTIYGHLAHYVGLGEIPSKAIIEDSRLKDLLNFLTTQQDLSSQKTLITNCHYKFSYAELKLGVTLKEKEDLK